MVAGNKWLIPFNLDGLAYVAAAHSQYERALRLAGAATALSEATGMIVGLPAWRLQRDHWLGDARRAVGVDAAAALWAAAGAMTLEEAIAYALAEEPDDQP